MDFGILAQYGAVGLLIIVAVVFRDHPKHGWATRLALPLGIAGAVLLAGIQVYQAWFTKDPTLVLRPEGDWTGFYTSGAPVEKVEAAVLRGDETIASNQKQGLSTEKLKDRKFTVGTDTDRLRLWLNETAYGYVPVRDLQAQGWRYADILPPESRVVTDRLYKSDQTSPMDGLQLQVTSWNFSKNWAHAGAVVRFQWKDRRGLSCDLNRSEWKHFEYPGELNLLAQALWLHHDKSGEENITIVALTFPSKRDARIAECEPLR